MRNYWNGEVALICSHCPKYNSFGSVEELRSHIAKEHPLVIVTPDIDCCGGKPPTHKECSVCGCREAGNASFTCIKHYDVVNGGE